MRIETCAEIGGWLSQANDLSEALMRELRLDRFGYSVHVVFTVVIDAGGRVLAKPIDVAFDLDGVEQLRLDGGLTSAMLRHPEEIDWGLSEVARVRITPDRDGVRFEALWESGGRRIDIRCHRAALTVPSR